MVYDEAQREARLQRQSSPEAAALNEQVRHGAAAVCVGQSGQKLCGQNDARKIALGPNSIPNQSNSVLERFHIEID